MLFFLERCDADDQNQRKIWKIPANNRRIQSEALSCRSKAGNEHPSLLLRVDALLLVGFAFVVLRSYTYTPLLSPLRSSNVRACREPSSSAATTTPLRRWYCWGNQHGTVRSAVATSAAAITTTTTTTSATDTATTSEFVCHGGFAFQLSGQRGVDKASSCRGQLRGQKSAGRGAPTKLGTNESNASVG